MQLEQHISKIKRHRLFGLQPWHDQGQDQRRDVKPGVVVYVWRANTRASIRGWVGPGLVINVNEPGTNVWVSMRGVLVQCSRESEAGH